MPTDPQPAPSPWQAVLAWRDGHVTTWAEVDDPHDVLVSIARGTAAPVDKHGDGMLCLPSRYDRADLVAEFDGEDFDTLGEVEVLWERAQAMAAGLNAADARTEVRAGLDRATALRRTVEGRAGDGPYPGTLGELADEIVRWIDARSPDAGPELATAVLQRLHAQAGERPAILGLGPSAPRNPAERAARDMVCRAREVSPAAGPIRDHHFTPMPFDVAGANPVWSDWCSYMAGPERVCGQLANVHVERAYRFEGGPWDCQTQHLPRAIVPGHCMPGDGPGGVWAPEDSWPGAERYAPTGTDHGGETVIMRWRHATAEEVRWAQAEREERNADKLLDLILETDDDGKEA